MSHVVELTIGDGDLADKMGKMRDWLDHKGRDPIRFETSPHSLGHLALRIDFDSAADADAFAQVFGGRRVTTATEAS